ncbi:phosphotransferase [Corynebacterium halotolerans]|uniref:phosphotransferase n=1 Tax=Corynebacterium halotolerans TaxID=225326 RepID=UPI000B0E2DE8|nr:phosphotransferase [Corynebacterium halotolerans]
MTAQLTKILADRQPPDAAVSGDPEITVISRTPFDGGEHVIASTGGTGLVQVLLDAEGNELTGAGVTVFGQALAAGDPPGAAALHGEMPAGLTGRVLPGDRANTLLIYADDTGRDRVVVKVYRHLEPGPHPEVEVLSAIPSAFVPDLLGHVTTDIDGETYTLATVQRFLDGADGFHHTAEHAAAQMFSYRVTHRFAETLRMIHDSLAMAFPTTTVPVEDVTGGLEQRLDGFLGHNSELDQQADWIREFYRSLTGPCDLQRVHGDLHLGQTLYDDTNWLFLDFEGDARLPFAERRRPDTPLRDVAGVLNSLYHASEGQRAWLTKTSEVFFDGYGHSEDSPLLTALRIDRIVQDVLRETEQRPDMVDLPLRALPYLRAKAGA